MVLNSAFNNEPDSWNADLKAGPITLRVTHAIISSEIELLLTLMSTVCLQFQQLC